MLMLAINEVMHTARATRTIEIKQCKPRFSRSPKVGTSSPVLSFEAEGGNSARGYRSQWDIRYQECQMYR